MSLVYKNFTLDEILNKLRNIRYANQEMLFGYNNTIELDLTLELDVIQLSLQADIFAREFFTLSSKMDFKRFLGPYRDEWKRILHEVYVYDRLKCIYYGIMSYNLIRLPDETYSFPGNIVLMNSLIKKNYQYNTGDAQPFSFYLNVLYNPNYLELFEQVFEIYPSLREGISENIAVVSYVNSEYENVLKGIFFAKQYLDSRNSGNKGNASKEWFSILKINDESLSPFATMEQTPIANSFLNSNGDEFYFILPYDKSGPQALRFNESIFAGRAMGFKSDQLEFKGNNFYNVSERKITTDFMTREEVYAITGLKSEMVPYSESQMKSYLGFDHRKTNVGGDGTIPPF